MGNIIPQQTRTVDPFTEFNSNVINSLTKAITGDQDAIFAINALNVVAASNTQVEVSRGVVFMQDVVLTITQDFIVDFADQDFYVEDFPGGAKPPALDQTGYYYVVVDYTYEKVKPAPVARYRILKPGQRARISEERFLFLKAVLIINSGGFVIGSVSDFDPDDVSVARSYSPTFIGYTDTRPTYQSSQHKDRLIFESNSATFYKGDDNLGDWALVAGGVQDGDLGEVWGGQLKSPRFHNTQDSTDVGTMEGMIIDLDNEFIKLGGGNDPNRYNLWFNKDDDGNLHFGDGAIQWDNLDDTSKQQMSTELKVIYNPDVSQPTIPATPPGLVFDDGDLDGNWSFNSPNATWASMATRSGVVWSSWSTPFRLAGGQNAYSTILTNVHLNVPVYYNGTLKPTSLNNATTEVLVFLGTSQYDYDDALSVGSTFRIPHTGGVIAGTACDATIDTTTGVITLTDLTADNATIDFTVETSDGINIDAMNWNIVKVYDGTDGASKLISLSSNEGFVFKHDSATTLTYPSDGKITLQASAYGIDTTALEWQYWDPSLSGGAGAWSSTFASGVDFVEIDGLDNVPPNFDNSTVNIRTFRAMAIDPATSDEIWDSQPLMHITEGLQGPAGDANYVWLEATPNLFFKYDEEGNPEYTTITLTAYRNNISALDYRWSYYIDGTGWIDIGASDDQSTHIVSHTEIIGNSTTFRVSLDNTADTRFDQITLGKIHDGEDSYQVFLSNNSHGIPVDAVGTPLTGGYTGAYTDVQAFRGATELSWVEYDSTANPAFGEFTINDADIVATGIDFTLDTAQGRITFSNITINVATVDIPFTFSDGNEITVSATVYKAYSGADGFNAYTVGLTNENHTVATNAVGEPNSGQVGQGGAASTQVIAYRGDTALTYTNSDTPTGNQFSILNLRMRSGGTGWSFAEDTTTGEVYISSIASTSDDDAILLIDIYFPDGITITKSFTLNKSFGLGYVNLASDSLVIKYDTLGALDAPATITLIAEPVGVNSPSYIWYVKYDGSGSFSPIAGTDSTQLITSPATSSGVFSNIATYRVEVYESSAPLSMIDSDEVTITKFENLRGNDGVGTYTVVLTNENHTVSVDPGGNAETGEITSVGRAVTAIISYYEGSAIVYSSNPNPVSGEYVIENLTWLTGTGWNAAVNTANGQIYISSLATTASPTATLSIDIRYSDGTILKKVWSLDKKVNAMTVDVTATDLVMLYDTAGTLISPANITLQTTTHGTSGSTIWYSWYRRYDSVTSWGTPFQQGTQTSYNFTCPVTKTGTFVDKATYKVDISLSTDIVTVLDSDIITLVKSQNLKGDDGATGAEGTGYTASLDNESHTIRCDGAGVALTGEIGTINSYASTLVKAFVNTSQYTYTGSDTPSAGFFAIRDIVVTGTGWTVLENTSTGGFYVSALTTSASTSCSVEFNVRFPDGTNIPKTWSINKLNNAAVVHVTSTTQAIKYGTTGALIGPSSFTLNLTTGGVAVPRFDWYRSIDGGAFTLELSNQTATSRVITVASVSFSDTVTYEVRARESGGTVVVDTDRVTISKLKDGAVGAVGTDSYTVVLSNETHEIAVGDNGTPNYTGAFTEITVFKGNSSLAGVGTVPIAGQFRAVIGTQTNCTASRTAVDTVTVSSITADTASVDLTIQLEGNTVTVPKRMSLTRSKTNKSVRLSTDTQVFTYNTPTDPSATPFSAVVSVELLGGITSPTYQWQYRPNGGNWTTFAGTSSTNTIASNNAAFFPGSNTSVGIRCNVTYGGVVYSDEMTFQKVYGGADGIQGSQGPQGLQGLSGANGLEYWINPEFSGGTFFIQQPGYNGTIYTHFIPTISTMTIRHAGTETVNLTTTGLNTNNTNTPVTSGWNVTIAPRSFSTYRYITAADGVATITLVGVTSGIRKVYKLQRLKEVDGTYIGSNGIYTGSLTANQITAGTLNAGLITVTNLTASAITTGALRSTNGANLTFDVNNAFLKVVNNAGIYSYNASTEATSTYYSKLTSADLTFYARASTASAWSTYPYIARIESGTVSDNTYVTFPVAFRSVPKISLAMARAKVFESTGVGADQSLEMEAQTISTTGFRARLYHKTAAGGNIGQTNWTSNIGLGQVQSWTTPANTQSASVRFTVYPNTLINYYRDVIEYEIVVGQVYDYTRISRYSTTVYVQVYNGAWQTLYTATTNQYIPISQTFTVSVNMPSGGTWSMRIYYATSTANGSTNYTTGPYSTTYQRRVLPNYAIHYGSAVTATDPNSLITYIAMGS